MVRSEKLRQEFVMRVQDFKIPMKKDFLDAINEQCFSEEKNNIITAHSYSIIAYKYAGDVVNGKMYLFMNLIVYAGIITQKIDFTKSMLSWNEHAIFCLEREATIIMNVESSKRFIEARNEVMKRKRRIWG